MKATSTAAWLPTPDERSRSECALDARLNTAPTPTRQFSYVLGAEAQRRTWVRGSGHHDRDNDEQRPSSPVGHDGRTGHIPNTGNR